MKRQMFALLALVSTLIGGAGLQGSEWDCCGFDGNFYVGGFAGANFLQNIEHHHLETKYKTGFVGGASLGYELQSSIRLEAEFAYRRNCVKSFSYHGDDFEVDHVKATIQSYAAMANLLYDFDLCSDFTPYVGFGLGYGWGKRCIKIDVADTDIDFSISRNRNGFAFQGIAGVAYTMCGIDLGLEYRYFQIKSDYKNHAVAVSLRRGF